MARFGWLHVSLLGATGGAFVMGQGFLGCVWDCEQNGSCVQGDKAAGDDGNGGSNDGDPTPLDDAGSEPADAGCECDDNDPCNNYTCVEGACSPQPVNNGSPVGGTICKQCWDGSVNIVVAGTPCENNGVCDGAGACDECNADHPCPGELACSNGVCVLLDLGEDCVVDGNCQSNKCVDGKCCGNQCSDPCESCNPEGFEDCSVLDVGDNDEECEVDVGMCVSNGKCKLLIGQSCDSNNDCLSGYCHEGKCSAELPP